ncbi:MAG: class I SAM-dependent methyltransferase [Desulfotalea sp.]
MDSKENLPEEIDFNGEFSNEYDDVAHKIVPAYHLIYELTQHLLRSKTNEEARILVAGSGKGKEIIDFAQNNPKWSFTGFDPAKPMLSIAREKVTALDMENRISFVNGLINDVTENNFDAATSILVMHFLPDDGQKLSFLKGIAQKLKPCATLVLVDLEGTIGSEEYNTLSAAWKNQQIFTRGDDAKVLEEFELREKDVQCIPQKRTESLLAEAGFIKIQKFFQAYLFGGYIAIKNYK